MALTQADKNEMLNAIKAESQGVDELPVVSSLDGVISLPAIRGTEVVSAPIALLRKPAEDAAKSANTAATKANTAAAQAEAARESATQAAATANTAATTANTAAQTARGAADAAQTVVDQYEDVAVAALQGSTARFARFVESPVEIETESSIADGGVVVYLQTRKIFAYQVGGKYYLSWNSESSSSNKYNDSISEIQKDKIFLCGDTMYHWSEEKSELVEASGKGNGSGYYNVTELHPLTTGYYTKQTAVAKMADADIDDDQKRGMIITFEESAGKWVDYRFSGTSTATFLDPASWEKHGGADAVKQVTFNGNKLLPDSAGNVTITVNEVEVDDSLNPNSTNPVANSAITSKISEIEGSTLWDVDTSENDDGSMTVSLRSKSSVIASFDIPAISGGGGGGGDSSTSRISLSASVSAATIKEGGSSILSYTYDHQYFGGDDSGMSTGQKARIEIRVVRGSITVFTQMIDDVSKGTYTLDLTPHLSVGTTDIYVRAICKDPNTGKEQQKQAYTSVETKSLRLTSPYEVSSGISDGGYGSNDVVVIPFTINGTGQKTVTIYVDGREYDTRTITRSGSTNGSFNISLGTLGAGKHSVQLCAELQVGNLTLKSESIYFNIFKKGLSAPLIGAKLTFPDGRIFGESEHLIPRLEAGQYDLVEFDYAVYDPENSPASVGVYENGELRKTLTCSRSLQTYSNRFTTQGLVDMKLVCRETEYPFFVDVKDSGIEISEPTFGLQLKLTAAGRSNSEAQPDVWSYNGITTTFEDVDWRTSGWTGDALKLMNGAKATINFKPLENDAAITGKTIVIKHRLSNLVERENSVISCLSGGKGFEITADKASMYTGSTKRVTDEDGNETIQKVGVGRQFNEGEWVETAFVVGKRSEGSLMELYYNGIRQAADIYGDSDNFVQETPCGIEMSSDSADVEIRSIKVYDRALSDDELMDNTIVGQSDVNAMTELFIKNDVLGEDGKSIDFEKLRKKGKAVVLVVRPGGLEPINAENNKKTEFRADIHIWMPDGRYIILKNWIIKIQGTSSTKYSRKNYRIEPGEDSILIIDGVVQDVCEFALAQDQIPVSVINPKKDFSDSSMTQNTGGAKLFDGLLRSLGIKTPPQEYDPRVRTAIYGFPIDMFSAESMEETPSYFGQYNLNNDKSGWEKVIGMEGVPGFTPTLPIALEFLNNTQPLCLFQCEDDIDAQFDAQFDDALEFNYPKGIKWANADSARKEAIKKLWRTIKECVPAGANPNDLSTFVSPQFKAKFAQCFDSREVMVYYLTTDVKAMVDQRVKNIILATWDGVKWFIIFYDGDTADGDRNDCLLAYLYNVMRETWDSEKSKYAFEGHDSCLWNLMLANCQEELKSTASEVLEYLTYDKMISVLDGEQMDNWCGRVYNKSGYFTYIIPQIEGVNVKGQNVKYPHIYALKGDKQMFRHHFLRNRLSLLAAKYETGAYLSDNIDMYLTRTADAPANTMVIEPNEAFYFGYGTNNAPHLYPSVAGNVGEDVTLVFTNAYTVNDPIRVYGAGAMRSLDLRGCADNITGDLNLNKCKVLRKLDISTYGSGSKGWCMVLDGCRQLTDINLRGQAYARTGSINSTELNFSNQTKLEVLDATGVDVQAVIFAPGSPLISAKLGGSITTLRLESLPRLTDSGLTLQNYKSVKTLRFANCPNMDWTAWLQKCPNIDRLRVEGVNFTDDGSILRKYMGMKGVDENGNAVDYCAFTGDVWLTVFMEEEEMEQLRIHFKELSIHQPDYTIIEQDTSVADDMCISNLDNKTGYKFGNSFVPSGHINTILSRRHRCLVKITKKATSRTINFAGIEVQQCNLDGEAVYYPLHDEDSTRYADADDSRYCSEAKLDGSEGDIMMLEGDCWSKGVNDYLNNKIYTCVSSNPKSNPPKSPEAKIITLEDIKAARQYTGGQKIATGKATLASSLAADSTYGICRVDVSGYKRVRFPSVIGTSMIGAVFCDADGNVIESVIVPTTGSKFENGMYLIANIPEGAMTLHFTIQLTAEFDMVVLSNSDKIEDMAPYWQWQDRWFCGVVGSSVLGTKFRAIITGGSTIANMSWNDCHQYSNLRGMQQIDCMMHSWIAQLFFMKYGRLNSQMQCGAGSHSNNRVTGGTMATGMQDTVNTNGTTVGGYEWSGNSWVRIEDSNGIVTYKSIGNICCMGYEDIYGHKNDWMDLLDLPNNTGNAYKWRIWMPDGSTRMVKAMGTNQKYVTAIAHGDYMDVTPVGQTFGTQSTYYGDEYYVAGTAGRVVCRGGYNAFAYGGVVRVYASNAPSYADAYVGSRLAFRGKIEKAPSVEAFKAIVEVS